MDDQDREDVKKLRQLAWMKFRRCKSKNWDKKPNG